VHARLAVTVVVYELPWWVAATSTEPVATLTLVPLTDWNREHAMRAAMISRRDW
jgi:hypothetical protein